MKILFICHKTPYPANDGGAIATLNMIKGFANCGDKVTVLTMQTPKHAFPIDKLPAALIKNIKWNQVWVNTKIKPIRMLLNLFFSSEPYNAARFESNDFRNKLIQLLQSSEFDLVQLEGAYLGVYVNTIRKYSIAKISLRAHNVEHQIWRRLSENDNSHIKRLYYKVLHNRVKVLESNLIKQIDLLVPITNRDNEVLNSHFNMPSQVSPTGMDDNIFYHSVPKYNKTLFYIGALDWIPNIEALKWFIENVWKILSDDFSKWSFVIAGRNAPANFVDYLKTQKVQYLGEVESATQFIDDHNIMVVPLLSASGMRIKIIEGMARGKCIVTTSVGVEGIPARNGEVVFIEDQPQNMIAILSKLMQNPMEIERCAKNAFIFVQQNYNNNIIISELRNFYSKHIGIS